MTPSEKTILKSLVAVAWADGQVKEPESGVIEALLWAFDAGEADAGEIREFASKKRTFKDDIPVGTLPVEDRKMLLAHAALLTHADGKQTNAEKKLLRDLVGLLGFTEDEARPILDGAPERAKRLAGKV
jgi:tellurite resistance protein